MKHVLKSGEIRRVRITQMTELYQLVVDDPAAVEDHDPI